MPPTPDSLDELKILLKEIAHGSNHEKWTIWKLQAHTILEGDIVEGYLVAPSEGPFISNIEHVIRTSNNIKVKPVHSPQKSESAEVILKGINSDSWNAYEISGSEKRVSVININAINNPQNNYSHRYAGLDSLIFYLLTCEDEIYGQWNLDANSFGKTSHSN